MYTGHMQREYVPVKERGDIAGDLKQARKSNASGAFADLQGLRLDKRAVSCHMMRTG